MLQIRQIFPNPVCVVGCDFGAMCEQKNHYVGFRTAVQSRNIREGGCYAS